MQQAEYTRTYYLVFSLNLFYAKEKDWAWHDTTLSKYMKYIWHIQEHCRNKRLLYSNKYMSNAQVKTIVLSFTFAALMHSLSLSRAAV